MNSFSLVSSADLKLMYTGYTIIKGMYVSSWWLWDSKPERTMWLEVAKLGAYE